MATPARRKVCTLAKKIAALRISQDGNDPGLFTELPMGAELEVELPGLNDRMINVRHNGRLYRVFICDLEDRA
jgi:hypothetical protein